MTINQPCLHNRQCTGTKLAGLCRSGKCTCDTGYMLIDNNCYKGKQIIEHGILLIYYYTGLSIICYMKYTHLAYWCIEN